MATCVNRRRFARFTVEPMYTPITVRLLGGGPAELEGHAYDLSEGGARFELDRALPPGTAVQMEITLPSWAAGGAGAGAGAGAEASPRPSILVNATVIWIEDEEEPGPVRTAAVFDSFPRPGDRDGLLRQFSAGRFRVAA